MISNKIDEMIATAMKNREKELLEVLKLVKCEFVKATKDGVVLNDVTETKILLKMCSQREDSIRQYVDGGREDLANAEKAELDVINSFLPKQATDEEIENFTRATISSYCLTMDEGHKLSMRDMKPILTIVQETYPNANGKLVSKVLNRIVNNK